MVRDLLASETMEFGSVLITAGSEVGGGDRRASHGVAVSVLDCVVPPEGGYGLVARAGTALEVEKWLEDSPYPRAEVRFLRPAGIGPALVAMSWSRLVTCAQQVRILLARLADLDPQASRGSPPRDVLARLTVIASGHVPDSGHIDELEAAVWVVARAVPCGPLDRLGMLNADSVAARVTVLERVVEHVGEMLAFGVGPEAGPGS